MGRGVGGAAQEGSDRPEHRGEVGHGPWEEDEDKDTDESSWLGRREGPDQDCYTDTDVEDGSHAETRKDEGQVRNHTRLQDRKLVDLDFNFQGHVTGGEQWKIGNNLEQEIRQEKSISKFKRTVKRLVTEEEEE